MTVKQDDLKKAYDHLYLASLLTDNKGVLQHIKMAMGWLKSDMQDKYKEETIVFQK